MCVNRSYQLFASQKSIKLRLKANSLTQTFAQICEGVGVQGASSHIGRRKFLTHLANQGISFTCSRR
jgi:integrase/recombinase XerD